MKAEQQTFVGIPKFAEQWNTTGDIVPSVIFIEPNIPTTRRRLIPNDDHCPTGVAKGQQFLADIYKHSSANPTRWSKTLVIVTYDEHGGFFDHMTPMQVPCEAGGYAVTAGRNRLTRRGAAAEGACRKVRHEPTVSANLSPSPHTAPRFFRDIRRKFEYFRSAFSWPRGTNNR